MQKFRTVVIMRAAPGSGKSTFVKKNFPDAVICSADDFHINENGIYDWKPQNVHKSHEYCRDKFNKMLAKDEPIIVVDNTNIKIKEFEYYFYKAKEYGYDVRIVRIDTPLEKLKDRNIHNVPFDEVKRMYETMQDLPSEWKITELVSKGFVE